MGLIFLFKVKRANSSKENTHFSAPMRTHHIDFLRLCPFRFMDIKVERRIFKGHFFFLDGYFGKDNNATSFFLVYLVNLI